jgi:hypothetical protein
MDDNWVVMGFVGICLIQGVCFVLLNWIQK